MVSFGFNNKYRLILELSNINADFLQLVLCMFVSHALIGKPWFGAVLFIFMNIWLLYFQAGLQYLRPQNRTRMLMWTLLTISLVIGLGVIFLYPIISRQASANYVSFFVAIVGVRTFLTYKINSLYSRRKASHRWYKILFQGLFLIPCAVFALWLFDGYDLYIVVVGFLITGVLMSFQRSSLANFNRYIRSSDNSNMENIFSYRMFNNMSLYSNIAVSLGVLTYICYANFTRTSFDYMTYLMMALWLFILLFFSQFFTWLVRRRGIALGINVFLLGAVFWILGSVRMFGVNDLSGYGIWTLFWAFGLACINASLSSINSDFKMVAELANRSVRDKDLRYRSILMQVLGIITASCIVLVVLAVWELTIPTSHNAEMPRLFRNIVIQLPALFMLAGVFFALKQPLDKRSREKLVNYYRGTNKNAPTHENLSTRLVKKSRVRFGIKIIAFFVKPFLRLRVAGKHNMDPSKYPSIFVCNHGIFYGPIAAVIYLPTYFRPWVDKKMVDTELCTREAYQRWLYAFPLTERAKQRLARLAARIATWAINAFNPVAVERDNLRLMMNTFDDTVEALSQGDNVLIFPERPRHVVKNGKTFLLHEKESVGDMFTGFASIGRLYFNSTGKILRFYPVYANKRGHMFKIGLPIEFDPDSDPRDERQRIADYLRRQMLLLRGEEGYDAKALRKSRQEELKELKRLKKASIGSLEAGDVTGRKEIADNYHREKDGMRKRHRNERRELRPLIREDRKKARLERRADMLEERDKDQTAVLMANSMESGERHGRETGPKSPGNSSAPDPNDANN